MENVLLKDSVVQALRMLEYSAEPVLCLYDGSRIGYANQAACARLGYAREELLSQSLQDISETAASLLEAWQLLPGQPLDLELKHKEKRLLPFRLSSEEAIIDGITLHIVRLTAREIAHTPPVRDGNFPVDVLYFFNKDLRFTHIEYANRQLSGLYDSLLGKRLEEIVPEPFLSTLQSYYLKALKGERVHYEGAGPDGKYHVCTAAPVYGPGGEVQGGVIFCQEIIKLAEAHAHLERKVSLLEQSLKYYRTVARNIPEGMILLFDQDLQIVLAEGNVLPQFTGNTEPVEGLHIHEAFPETLLALQEPYFRNALQGGREAFELQSPDGRWFRCICCELQEPEDEKKYGLAVYLNIDPVKQAEQELLNRVSELRHSEKLYRTLVQNIPNGVLVMFDREFRYTAVEGKGLSQMGFDREQMLGHTLYEVFHPRVVEVLEPHYQAALGGHTTTFETKGIYQGTNYLITIIPVVGQEENIDGGMIIAFDTDKLKMVERELAERLEELEESRMMYRMLVGNIPGVSLILLDENLKVALVEGDLAEATGYQPDAITGKRAVDIPLTSELTLKEWKNTLMHVLQGDAISQELKAVNTGRWVRISLLPLSQLDSEIKGCMIVIFDIHERKTAEAESNTRLKELALLNDRLVKEIKYRKAIEENLQAYTEELKVKNQELEQFAYVASHDLQEPLRMVSSFTQLLANKYASELGPEAAEYMRFTIDGAHRMQALINDLLEYSRVGRRNHPTMLPLEQIVDNVLQNLSRKIEENSAEVQYSSLPEIMADRTQMMQLFQNLVSNAIKFRKQEHTPVIVIRTEERANTWLFSVSDNGIGFNMQHKDRIFNIFQRLHTREKYEGTGIGLALCKKIVEYHGGEIWVESVEGEGTTFYFTLAKHVLETP